MDIHIKRKILILIFISVFTFFTFSSHGISQTQQTQEQVDLSKYKIYDELELLGDPQQQDTILQYINNLEENTGVKIRVYISNFRLEKEEANEETLKGFLKQIYEEFKLNEEEHPYNILIFYLKIDDIPHLYYVINERVKEKCKWFDETLSSILAGDLEQKDTGKQIAEKIERIYKKINNIDDICNGPKLQAEILIGKNVYLIDDTNWENVLSLIPLTTRHYTTLATIPENIEDIEDFLINKDRDRKNHIKYDPMFIYHRENNNFDIESILIFLEQFRPQKVIIVHEDNNKPEQLLNLLNLIGKSKEWQIETHETSKYPELWKELWKNSEEYNKINYRPIVLSEKNYTVGLMASVFASYIGAPLVFSSEELKKYEYSTQQVYCIGNLSNEVLATCSKKYNLTELQNLYKKITNTNKVILVNPNDIDDKNCENFEKEIDYKKQLEQNNENSQNKKDLVKNVVIKKHYCKDSLVSPILASIKNELIIFTDVKPSPHLTQKWFDISSLLHASDVSDFYVDENENFYFSLSDKKITYKINSKKKEIKIIVNVECDFSLTPFYNDYCINRNPYITKENENNKETYYYLVNISDEYLNEHIKRKKGIFTYVKIPVPPEENKILKNYDHDLISIGNKLTKKDEETIVTVLHDYIFDKDYNIYMLVSNSNYKIIENQEGNKEKTIEKEHFLEKIDKDGNLLSSVEMDPGLKSKLKLDSSSGEIYVITLDSDKIKYTSYDSDSLEELSGEEITVDFNIESSTKLPTSFIEGFNKYKEYIQSAVGNDIKRTALIAAIISQQSSWNDEALGVCGEAGIAQFIPEIAKKYKLEVPDYNSVQSSHTICKEKVPECHKGNEGACCTLSKQDCTDERFIPEKAIPAMAKLLDDLIKRCGDSGGTYEAAIRAYIGGKCNSKIPSTKVFEYYNKWLKFLSEHYFYYFSDMYVDDEFNLYFYSQDSSYLHIMNLKDLIEKKEKYYHLIETTLPIKKIFVNEKTNKVYFIFENNENVIIGVSDRKSLLSKGFRENFRIVNWMDECFFYSSKRNKEKEKFENNIETNFNEIKDDIKSQIEEDYDYLTIISSPNSIPISKYSQCDQKIKKEYRISLDFEYLPSSEEKRLSAAVGRIFGITVSDTSAYVNRIVVFSKNGYSYVPREDKEIKFSNTLLLASGFPEQQQWILSLEQQLRENGYKTLCFVGSKKIANDNCKYQNKIDYKLLEQNDIIIYDNHGDVNKFVAYNIHSNIIRNLKLHSPIIISDACSTIDYYRSFKDNLIGVNFIRRGALGYYGSVSVTSVTQISKEIITKLLQEDYDLGNALLSSKNILQNTDQNTQHNAKNEEYLNFILLGDPTIQLDLVKKIEITETKAETSSAPKCITGHETTETKCERRVEFCKDYKSETECLTNSADLWGGCVWDEQKRKCKELWCDEVKIKKDGGKTYILRYKIISGNPISLWTEKTCVNDLCWLCPNNRCIFDEENNLCYYVAGGECSDTDYTNINKLTMCGITFDGSYRINWKTNKMLTDEIVPLWIVNECGFPQYVNLKPLKKCSEYICVDPVCKQGSEECECWKKNKNVEPPSSTPPSSQTPPQPPPEPQIKGKVSVCTGKYDIETDNIKDCRCIPCENYYVIKITETEHGINCDGEKYRLTTNYNIYPYGKLLMKKQTDKEFICLTNCINNRCGSDVIIDASEILEILKSENKK